MVTHATIEVTRKRPRYVGIISTYLVFIDDDNVGVARRGRTVKFHVPPGTHTVKVWQRRGRAWSNRLTVTVGPGDVRSLGCEWDTGSFNSMVFGPLANGANQPRPAAAGGSASSIIKLYEL